MINERLLSEVRPYESELAELLKEPVLIVIKHILAKTQKKKIMAINTDRNENRMKFSAKLIPISALMD